jgi:hypothetical protein
MKKLMFVFALVLATAIIYGYNTSGQNKLERSNTKEAVYENIKETGKSEPEANRPGIMLILTADRSKSGSSSSFLRNYIYGTTGQAGC